jgi:hypothetical protein
VSEPKGLGGGSVCIRKSEFSSFFVPTCTCCLKLRIIVGKHCSLTVRKINKTHCVNAVEGKHVFVHHHVTKEEEEMTRAKTEWRAREAADAVEQEACLHGRPDARAVSGDGGPPPAPAASGCRDGAAGPARPAQTATPPSLPRAVRAATTTTCCHRPPRRALLLLLGLAVAPPAQCGSVLDEVSAKELRSMPTTSSLE